MALFGSVLYGGGEFYGGTAQDVPVDLRFYRTNTDGVYTFYWGFRFDYITPVLSTLTFELQIASDSAFTTNVSSFTDLNAITYQNGNVHKGFTVPVAARIDKVEQAWYARVRTVSGLVFSSWSETLQFIIPEKFEVEKSENIILNLPDQNVYGKEDLLKAVASRNTNLYTVANMYGKEFDQVELENLLTETNNYISLCRDEQLYDNFGIYFNYVKPQSQQFVEYRSCLRELILASLVGSTVDAINRVISCATGVNPTLKLIRQNQDFFLSTILEVPGGIINGSNTTFTTSSDYTINTLIVLKNGVVLTSGTDYTEDHSFPGFEMTVAPLFGDVLQVFFNIGLVGDPEPLVFDINDTTSLTGSVTFTNGSTAVTGTGTLFTTELSAGDTITDNTGLILGVVSNIIDNFTLTLVDSWIGDTSTGAAKKLQYSESEIPPSILWDQATLAWGLIIQVNNPGEFVLNETLIQALVNQLLPAHIKVFYDFL